MKIVQISATDEDDYRSFLSIYVDGKRELDFGDGEPEDGTLARDFGDCYNILGLIKLAYQAGKDGEPLEVEDKDLSFDEYCEYEED